MKTIMLVLSVLLILIQQAGATLITFDDITPADRLNSHGQVPSNYAGLGYEDFYVSLEGGIAAVSSPASIYSVPHGPAFLSSLSPFTLNSAYLTSEGGEGGNYLRVEVVGTYRGAVLYDNIYILLTTAPTWCIFNYEGIDNVEFRAPGSFLYYEAYFVPFGMDNIVINESPAIPESGTWFAGASLLLLLGVSILRKLLAANQAAALQQ